MLLCFVVQQMHTRVAVGLLPCNVAAHHSKASAVQAQCLTTRAFAVNINIKAPSKARC